MGLLFGTPQAFWVFAAGTEGTKRCQDVDFSAGAMVLLSLRRSGWCWYGGFPQANLCLPCLWITPQGVVLLQIHPRRNLA